MMHSLAELVSAWWTRDLIRVRPSEGRLLRLQPGAVLRFSVRPGAPPVNLEVVTRSSDLTSDEPTVCYQCRTNRHEGQLLVTCHGCDDPTVQWQVAGVSSSLDLAEIEVFPSDRRRRYRIGKVG